MTVPPDPAARFMSALCACEDVLSRFDTALQMSPLADGLISRLAFSETVAGRANLGDAISTTDLVLLDASISPGGSEVALERGMAALQRQRRARRLGAEALTDAAAVDALLDRKPESRRSPSAKAMEVISRFEPPFPPHLPTIAAGDTAPSPALTFTGGMQLPNNLKLDEDGEVLEFFFARREVSEGWPALVRALVDLDLWMQLAPAPQHQDLRGLVARSALLRAGRLKTAPLLLESGVRALQRVDRRWTPGAPPLRRAMFWLAAIHAGAREGLAQLQQLSIARQRFDLLISGRRGNSRLPDLAGLFLRMPLVTVPLAAGVLGVSSQAVRVMMKTLEPALRELTGRNTYRAWRI